MNERDSEAVAAQFLSKGYTIARSEDSADVILLNTCSVRDQAEKKAIGKMQNIARSMKRKGSDVLLGFLGCMAQSRGEELISQIGVDLVVGTQKFHRTADHVDDLLSGQRQSVCDIDAEKGSESEIKDHVLALPGKQNQVTGFVSIMQGCNQYCTFCIVPYTRGEERSRSIDDIVAECEALVDHGVKEITLLGQIVTSYGKREIPMKDSKSAFVQLLEAVNNIPSLKRIRFTSPHPKGYGDDLAEAYSRLEKLCESAHIPVQSGSDRVLKLMHRGYTRKRFLEIIEKLRKARPEVGITTDVIVGFPGESEEDFEETLSLVREVEFDNAYLFKYSPRKDTPAASLPEQVPQEVREERHARLLSLVNQLAEKRYERYLNKKVEILVEGPSRRNAERLQGRTRCNKIVVFEGSERHIGQLMDLKIERVGSFTLYGNPAILNLD
jgi:tRNA-2-methylthio-N6-dimethylallyladenosine synthase